jgi:hypothetical protein
MPRYIPAIAEKDYDAFKSILRIAIPDLYSGWLDQVSRWREHYASEGHRLVEVPAGIAELNAYLRRQALPQNLNQLFEFAEWVAKGRAD